MEFFSPVIVTIIITADEAANDIHEIEWSSIVWNEPVRRLINQSHGLSLGLSICLSISIYIAFFTKLQGLGQGEVDPKEVVEFSRLYRSVLHECILGLQKVIDEGGITKYFIMMLLLQVCRIPDE